MGNRFFLYLKELDTCNEQYRPDRCLEAVRGPCMVGGPMSPRGSTVGSPSAAAPASSWHSAEPGWGLEPHPKQLLSEHSKFWKARIDLGS